MAETVNLLIFPSVQEGMDEDEVKAKLIKTLKIDQAKVDAWFDSEVPTVILSDVDEEVANRYVKAIMNCGGECNTNPSGEDSLSLIPKTANKNTKLFICPSCEYDEDIPLGTEIEQCPKCGLVLAKWEERMAEEAEKEKIRRRLLREARLKEDGSAEVERRKAELERLRKLEREIMLELGIKPPSKFWLFFEQHTFLVGLAMLVAAVSLSGAGFYYLDLYMEETAKAELVAAPADDEIVAIAPTVGDAIALQQSGNEQVVEEIADVTQVMRGQDNKARETIVKAAQQMMKGADPEKFVAVAAKMSLPAMNAKPAPGDPGPIPVNIDTIGGISGLTGQSSFEPKELMSISEPLLKDGHEGVLSVLNEKHMKPDPVNPDGPDLVVEAIEELDGSMIVDLMNTLAKDQEWDQFLASHVDRFLAEDDFEQASELTKRIKNPVVKIQSLTELIAVAVTNQDSLESKVLMAQIRLTLDEVEDSDTSARLLITLAEKLAAAGSPIEPENTFSQIESLANNSDNLYDKSVWLTRLAVAYSRKDNKAKARSYFSRATTIAGQIQDPALRISAFSRIAPAYFDARNTTLANEILAEAEVLAATQLEPEVRAKVFADIAMARGYMGDFAGARMAIDNAAKEQGRQQLLAKLAEMLLSYDRYYDAMSVMDSLTNNVERTRLEVRLISRFIHSDRVVQAQRRLASVANIAHGIMDLSQRGLLLSQLARLAARVGEPELAESLFSEAMDLTKSLSGRKAQLNMGLVALDRARVFQFASSEDTMEQLTDIVVKDPISNEIAVTERVTKTFLPQLMPKSTE